MQDSQIGYTLAIAGCIASAIQFFILPHLLRRYDAGMMYNACMYSFPAAFAMMPLLNMIASSNEQSDALVWVGIALTMMWSRIGNVSFSLSMILTKQHAPSPDSLGSVNGLVQWAMCLARAFAPAVVR